MPIMLTPGDMRRTMELDEVGIDRFFDAIGEMPLSAEIGYLPEEEYHVQEEERKPKLEIRCRGVRCVPCAGGSARHKGKQILLFL